MAGEHRTEDPMRVQLRRYPNRRYYDAARSQHLTLEEIFQLICDGHEVQVSDSKSGEDITVRVLAQLILEQAPSKLALLPAEMLHQIIRSSESLLRDFIDRYFCRAFSAFIESQREFDRCWRQALGLSSTEQEQDQEHPSRGASHGTSFPFLVPNWAAPMMGPFARAMLSGDTEHADNQLVLAQVPEEESDVRKAVEELRRQVASLRDELRNGQDGRDRGPVPTTDNQDDHG